MSIPPNIRTEHIYPPIPLRSMDWMATVGAYEPGCKVGYGATEQAAIRALLDQIEEEEVERDC